MIKYNYMPAIGTQRFPVQQQTYYVGIVFRISRNHSLLLNADGWLSCPVYSWTVLETFVLSTRIFLATINVHILRWFRWN